MAGVGFPAWACSHSLTQAPALPLPVLPGVAGASNRSAALHAQMANDTHAKKPRRHRSKSLTGALVFGIPFLADDSSD